MVAVPLNSETERGGRRMGWWTLPSPVYLRRKKLITEGDEWLEEELHSPGMINLVCHVPSPQDNAD